MSVRLGEEVQALSWAVELSEVPCSCISGLKGAISHADIDDRERKAKMNHRQRPRILMLTSTLPRWDDDIEPRFVLDLARHLSEDFDVELLAPHAAGAARSEILEGVQITRFRYWFPRWESVAYEGGISWRLKENPFRLLQVPPFLWSLAWHLVRRLRREPRIDLVHSHWIIPQGLVSVMLRGLSKRRVPVVCTSHGGDLFSLRGAGWRILKRLVMQKSDAVTVVSHAMANAAIAIAKDVNPIVIPMGTDLASKFVPPIKPRSSVIRNLIFVGRLVEKKGVRYLLEAMAGVATEFPFVRLKIIGHGPLRPVLEADVKRLGLGDIVSFLGPVPHHLLAVHYQSAEVAVFPFVEAASGDQEGFGLVMVEAMGCGCIVIASDLPAVRDVICDGETGLLVTSADPQALASSITSVLRNPKTNFALAQRGRHYARANFDWSASAGRFREEFLRLTERAGS